MAKKHSLFIGNPVINKQVLHEQCNGYFWVITDIVQSTGLQQYGLHLIAYCYNSDNYEFGSSILNCLTVKGGHRDKLFL